jgi:hypothetical protein
MGTTSTRIKVSAASLLSVIMVADSYSCALKITGFPKFMDLIRSMEEH